MIPLKKLENGIEMPVLGLGTWLMGGDFEKKPSPQDDIDIRAIRSAIEMGYTHIDTAEIYAAGYSEELVAQAVKGTARENLFIATKAMRGNHTATLLEQSLNNSLARLKTDYVDLYYLHQPTPEIPFEETAKGLNRAYRDGKIRHVGVCNFSKERFDDLQRYLDMPIIANQVHYNLVFREAEVSGLIDHAQRNDYFVIAWRPLRFKKRNASHSSVETNAWETGAFPLLDEIAAKYGKTNVQIALNWTTHKPNVLTLVKSSNPTHLQDAAGSFDWRLDDADYQKLDRDFKPVFKTSDTIPLI